MDLYDPPKKKMSKLISELARGCHDFTSKFHKIISKTTEENIVHSPFGLHILLSYIFCCAKEVTMKEMVFGLYLYDTDAVHVAYADLIKELYNLPVLEKKPRYNELESPDIGSKMVNVANGLFVHESISLSEICQELGSSCFAFEHEKVNFDIKKESAKAINAWTSKKTHDKINNIVKPGDIEDNTKVMLVNAVFFKARWQFPFDRCDTQKSLFHVNETLKKQIPTMQQTWFYQYGEIPSLQSTFIEIPYLTRAMNLTVILPNTIEGLKFAEENFDWNAVIKAKTDRTYVELKLPKFRIEAKLNLKDAVIKMGMKSMFEPLGDFPDMTVPKLRPPIHVYSIVQKVFIEVNENGTEADALTRGACYGGGRPPKKVIFHVNRPFIVAVRHGPSDIPVLISSVRDIGENLTTINNAKSTLPNPQHAVHTPESTTRSGRKFHK